MNEMLYYNFCDTCRPPCLTRIVKNIYNKVSYWIILFLWEKRTLWPLWHVKTPQKKLIKVNHWSQLVRPTINQIYSLSPFIIPAWNAELLCEEWMRDGGKNDYWAPGGTFLRLKDILYSRSLNYRIEIPNVWPTEAFGFNKTTLLCSLHFQRIAIILTNCRIYESLILRVAVVLMRSCNIWAQSPLFAFSRRSMKWQRSLRYQLDAAHGAFTLFSQEVRCKGTLHLFVVVLLRRSKDTLFFFVTSLKHITTSVTNTTHNTNSVIFRKEQRTNMVKQTSFHPH